MADELNKTPGRKVTGKKKGKPAKFDHDLIEGIENRERLKIWHLGRYANWYGMPAGAILLFSQLASHLRDGTKEDLELAASIAEAVKQVCEYVTENANALIAEAAHDGERDRPRDRKLEALVRECAYKDASFEQKRRDARLITALYQILNQYSPEARTIYREHSGKKFTSQPESRNA